MKHTKEDFERLYLCIEEERGTERAINNGILQLFIFSVL